MADEQKQPVVITDITAPSISRHTASITTRLPQSTPPQDERPTIASTVSQTVQPPSVSQNKEDKSPPISAPTQEATTTVSEQPVTPKETDESNNKDNVENQFAATDALPDASEQHATEITNTMTSPKIYDTSEYIVPISASLHTHGTTGKIVAGIISGLLILVIVCAIALLLT